MGLGLGYILPPPKKQTHHFLLWWVANDYSDEGSHGVGNPPNPTIRKRLSLVLPNKARIRAAKGMKKTLELYTVYVVGKLGGGFKYFLFSPQVKKPYLGKIPILTSIFFRWLEIQPPTRKSCLPCVGISSKKQCSTMHQSTAFPSNTRGGP